QAPEARTRGPLGFAESELSLLVDFCEVKLMDDRPETAASVLGRWRQHRLTRDEHMRLLDEVRVLARRDLAFLREHDDFNRIPVMLYLQLDPHEADYDDRLDEILRWFPECRLADNLELERILRRSHTLDEIENLLAKYPSGDATPRMMLVLARGYHVQGKTARAVEMLERLIRDFPDADDVGHARDFLTELDADDATH
ncbi:MAG TPA: hypothetical protein VMX57_03125, partial [Planctomycetota bacterium]|nr:hypothetical protein [Planctomycetota bacterium]